MTCSHVTLPPFCAVACCGRIPMGGGFGAGVSGLGPGTSSRESHTGACRHAPSPLQSHSQLHAALAVSGANERPNAKAAARAIDGLRIVMEYLPVVVGGL